MFCGPDTTDDNQRGAAPVAERSPAPPGTGFDSLRPCQRGPPNCLYGLGRARLNSTLKTEEIANKGIGPATGRDPTDPTAGGRRGTAPGRTPGAFGPRRFDSCPADTWAESTTGRAASLPVPLRPHLGGSPVEGRRYPSIYQVGFPDRLPRSSWRQPPELTPSRRGNRAPAAPAPFRHGGRAGPRRSEFRARSAQRTSTRASSSGRGGFEARTRHWAAVPSSRSGRLDGSLPPARVV